MRPGWVVKRWVRLKEQLRLNVILGPKVKIAAVRGSGEGGRFANCAQNGEIVSTNAAPDPHD